MKKVLVQFKNGFTLAEVLITLVIIGVIAAVTIPTLVNTTKKNEYVASLKKSNSLMAQALYKMTENNAYPVGDYSYLDDLDFIDEFAKVVNFSKKCDTFSECFAKNLSGSENAYRHLNDTTLTITNGKALITADGQIYSAAKLPASSAVFHGLSQEDADNAYCRIIVDVNGEKKPNKFGYDAFIFYVVKNKGIVPAGAYTTSSCNKDSHGSGCAARVLRENAINY